jgi:hypothetical protein
MLDELQEHVESIDMANGKNHGYCTSAFVDVILLTAKNFNMIALPHQICTLLVD